MQTKVIIGAGPAGLFAAIRCKEQNPKASVIVLEKTNQPLAKVRISGGGRCNVTHHCFNPQELIQNYPRGSKELLGPFHTFQPKDTISWFEARGVFLKTEEDGRMFPTTDSSETIIHCLLTAAHLAGVDLRRQQSIQSIEKKGEKFLITLADGAIEADQLLLATGSSPWGHKIAERLGHKIIDPVPSLFTFNVPTSPLLDLAGVSVPKATVSIKGLPFQKTGPLLITHWGFSGPAILKLSAWAARELHMSGYKATLLINWTDFPNEETLYQSLKEDPLQTLPKSLCIKLLSALDIDPKEPLAKLPHKTLRKLSSKLTSDPYQIEGKTTYKQEFVTAGGVHLKEIDFKTLQSKLTPNLFFAGEILNIDGITGGFNFQNTWTTGFIAGSAMARC